MCVFFFSSRDFFSSFARVFSLSLVDHHGTPGVEVEMGGYLIFFDDWNNQISFKD